MYKLRRTTEIFADIVCIAGMLFFFDVFMRSL